MNAKIAISYSECLNNYFYTQFDTVHTVDLFMSISGSSMTIFRFNLWICYRFSLIQFNKSYKVQSC